LDGKVNLSHQELVEDTLVLQIGGSDTTKASIIYSCYHLAVDQKLQQVVRDEILNAVPRGEPLQFSHIAKLPLLEALINESLKLHPPVPSGLQRDTPPEGIWVVEIFIPEGIAISTPTYTVHRSKLVQFSA
jgi:cytochrome P450